MKKERIRERDGESKKDRYYEKGASQRESQRKTDSKKKEREREIMVSDPTNQQTELMMHPVLVIFCTLACVGRRTCISDSPPQTQHFLNPEMKNGCFSYILCDFGFILFSND